MITLWVNSANFYTKNPGEQSGFFASFVHKLRSPLTCGEHGCAALQLEEPEQYCACVIEKAFGALPVHHHRDDTRNIDPGDGFGGTMYHLRTTADFYCDHPVIYVPDNSH